MRLSSTVFLLVSFAALPALCQNLQTSAASTKIVAASVTSDPASASVDFATLREDVSRQNKVLTDQVAAQRAIVKKNQELLKEAQKINAANLKLTEERKKLDSENAALGKERETLKAAQKPLETAESQSPVASR